MSARRTFWLIGVPQGSWDAQITAARNAWNGAAIAPDFNEVPISVSNEVNIEVRDWGPFTPWGGQAVVIEWTSGKIRKMRVDLNDNAQFGPSTALVVHELGHVLQLAHDGLNPDNNGDGLPDLDNECGTSRVPQTIMDYDCYVGNPFLASPVNWDACGVNHLYYAGSYPGC